MTANILPIRRTSPAEPKLDYSKLHKHRGYLVQYRQHEVNHCPGCSGSQWFVGRFSAECAFCGTALYLVEGR